MPLHTEASDLRQDIDNNEHATGRRVDLTGALRNPLAKASAKMCNLLLFPVETRLSSLERR